MDGRDVDPVEPLGLLRDVDDHLLRLRHVARAADLDVAPGNDDTWGRFDTSVSAVVCAPVYGRKRSAKD
jgi:hypothetical protein